MIYLNEKELKITKFPNGESCISLEDVKECLRNRKLKKYDAVVLCFESNEDLINLMFLKRTIDLFNREAVLVLTYTPYSRMDRIEDKVFTLKFVSEFINNLGFKYVSLLEPHSDVSTALINNSINLEFCAEEMFEIKKLILDEENISDEDFYFVFPDAGAQKRYCKEVKDGKYLTGFKVRDFKTGRIKSLEIIGEKPEKPFKALIVDDLCSRGGTFMLTAEKLKEMGATDIRLLVAHCEDTIHEGDIFKTDLISKVYTTDSILKNFDNEKLEVIRLNTDCEFGGIK